MRVLLINGSPNTNGNTTAALAVVQERLHKDGLETEWLQLEKKPVRGCVDNMSNQLGNSEVLSYE